MAGVVPRRPADDHHASAQVTDRDDPRLAIIATVVLELDRPAIEHLHGVGEIQPAIRERPVPLVRIETDAHAFTLRAEPTEV